MVARFNACGVASISSDKAFRAGKTKKDNKDYLSCNFRINNSANNSIYVETFGMADDIKTQDTDNNKITISFSDRFDKDVIDQVASYKKNVVRISDEPIEFISPYDLVAYIKENKSMLDGKKLIITGQINKDFYNGTARDKYQIQNIYLADEDRAQKMTATFDFVWDKDSVDISDWNENKTIIFNGWTMTYVSEMKQQMYVPQQVVFDASKINFEDEKHVSILKFKLIQMNLDYVDGKIKNNNKTGKHYKIPVICSIINGQEEIPFDESTLTPNQKMSIELGLKTLNDFRPSGSLYGEKVTQYKVFDFVLKDEYENGCIDTELTQEEFDDGLYAPGVVEKLPEIDDGFINLPSGLVDESVDDLFN